MEKVVADGVDMPVGGGERNPEMGWIGVAQFGNIAGDCATFFITNRRPTLG